MKGHAHFFSSVTELSFWALGVAIAPWNTSTPLTLMARRAFLYVPTVQEWLILTPIGANSPIVSIRATLCFTKTFIIVAISPNGSLCLESVLLTDQL
jgi:hypothetical protein